MEEQKQSGGKEKDTQGKENEANAEKYHPDAPAEGERGTRGTEGELKKQGPFSAIEDLADDERVDGAPNP